MPTYKNINTNKQKIENSLLDTNNIFKQLPYNKTIETYMRYDDNLNLLLVDEKPYWNPVIDSTKIILSNSDDFQVLLIDKDVHSIEIINSSSEIIYLFYQSYENTPGFPIVSGLTRTLNNFNRYVNQLVFKASGAVIDNEVFVTQFRE